MSNMDQSKQKKKDFTSSIQENYQNSFGFNVKSLGNLLNQPSDLSTAKDGSAKPASAMSILSGVKSIINGTNSHDTNMNPQTQAQQSAKQMKLLAGIVQKFRIQTPDSHLGFALAYSESLLTPIMQPELEFSWFRSSPSSTETLIPLTHLTSSLNSSYAWYPPCADDIGHVLTVKCRDLHGYGLSRQLSTKIIPVDPEVSSKVEEAIRKDRVFAKVIISSSTTPSQIQGKFPGSAINSVESSEFEIIGSIEIGSKGILLCEKGIDYGGLRFHPSSDIEVICCQPSSFILRAPLVTSVKDSSIFGDSIPTTMDTFDHNVDHPAESSVHHVPVLKTNINWIGSKDGEMYDALYDLLSADGNLAVIPGEIDTNPKRIGATPVTVKTTPIPYIELLISCRDRLIRDTLVLSIRYLSALVLEPSPSAIETRIASLPWNQSSTPSPPSLTYPLPFGSSGTTSSPQSTSPHVSSLDVSTLEAKLEHLQNENLQLKSENIVLSSKLINQELIESQIMKVNLSGGQSCPFLEVESHCCRSDNILSSIARELETQNMSQNELESKRVAVSLLSSDEKMQRLLHDFDEHQFQLKEICELYQQSLRKIHDLEKIYHINIPWINTDIMTLPPPPPVSTPCIPDIDVLDETHQEILKTKQFSRESSNEDEEIHQQLTESTIVYPIIPLDPVDSIDLTQRSSESDEPEGIPPISTIHITSHDQIITELIHILDTLLIYNTKIANQLNVPAPSSKDILEAISRSNIVEKSPQVEPTSTVNIPDGIFLPLYHELSQLFHYIQLQLAWLSNHSSPNSSTTTTKILSSQHQINDEERKDGERIHDEDNHSSLSFGNLPCSSTYSSLHISQPHHSSPWNKEEYGNLLQYVTKLKNNFHILYEIFQQHQQHSKQQLIRQSNEWKSKYEQLLLEFQQQSQPQSSPPQQVGMAIFSSSSKDEMKIKEIPNLPINHLQQVELEQQTLKKEPNKQKKDQQKRQESSEEEEEETKDHKNQQFHEEEENHPSSNTHHTHTNLLHENIILKDNLINSENKFQLLQKEFYDLSDSKQLLYKELTKYKNYQKQFYLIQSQLIQLNDELTLLKNLNHNLNNENLLLKKYQKIYEDDLQKKQQYYEENMCKLSNLMNEIELLNQEKISTHQQINTLRHDNIQSHILITKLNQDILHYQEMEQNYYQQLTSIMNNQIQLKELNISNKKLLQSNHQLILTIIQLELLLGISTRKYENIIRNYEDEVMSYEDIKGKYIQIYHNYQIIQKNQEKLQLELNLAKEADPFIVKKLNYMIAKLNSEKNHYENKAKSLSKDLQRKLLAGTPLQRELARVNARLEELENERNAYRDAMVLACDTYVEKEDGFSWF